MMPQPVPEVTDPLPLPGGSPSGWTGEIREQQGVRAEGAAVVHIHEYAAVQRLGMRRHIVTLPFQKSRGRVPGLPRTSPAIFQKITGRHQMGRPVTLHLNLN